MLGHLFRLPVEGGDAEQLTFGPYYDRDPAISPDGTRMHPFGYKDVDLMETGKAGRQTGKEDLRLVKLLPVPTGPK